MLVYLFVLFTVVPLVELALLIWIGGETVWWLPVAFVLFTAVAGAVLARRQGWRVGQRIQSDLRAGRLPASAMMDGFLILIAAILLITPGVLTDVFGIALLLPPVRSLVKQAVLGRLRRQVEVKTAQFTSEFEARGGASKPTSSGRDTIIDAKVIRTHVEDAK
jgi:UPF0716 protein FxsA